MNLLDHAKIELDAIGITEDGQPFKSYYTNSDSRVIIEFPYTSTSEYLERPND